MLAVVGHRHRLGEALRLVVHTARSDRIDVSPVGLGLRVDLGVSVHLAGRGEHGAGALRAGQTHGLVRAQRAHLERLDRPAEVVGRRRRRGKMEDEIDLARYVQVVGDVVLDEPERTAVEQVRHVVGRTGDEVVDARDA